MNIDFDQAALKAIDDEATLVGFVADLGQQAADRANASAERLFKDQGGGGIGSIESHIEHDTKGVYARVAYPPEHFYMWIHEVGSEREKPRPHVRPALFGTKSSTGGKTSAIKSIQQSKSAGKVTKRNRELAKARKATRRSNG